MLDYTTYEKVIVDGTDEAEEGVWKSSSDEPVLLPTFWLEGEPNSSDGDEDCMDMRRGKPGGFNDIDCYLWFDAALCECAY